MKTFKKLIISSLTVLGFFALSVNANAACGKLVIAEQNWASAELMANVDKIILEKGYGCEVEENSKYDNDKAIYLFNLNKRYDLDGDFKFNTARLINHSCNPNCEVTGTGFAWSRTFCW